MTNQKHPSPAGTMRIGRSGMMTKILGMLVLIPVVIFSQQSRLFWDGNDWRKVGKTVKFNPDLTYQVKAGYVNGLMDGRVFDYLKTWKVDSWMADSVYADMTDYLSTREIVRAVDFFYEDPLHWTIPVPNAMIIAGMYAEQVPLKTIDAYIQQSQYWINHLYLGLEEEGKADLLKKKQARHESKKKP